MASTPSITPNSGQTLRLNTTPTDDRSANKAADPGRDKVDTGNAASVTKSDGLRSEALRLQPFAERLSILEGALQAGINAADTASEILRGIAAGDDSGAGVRALTDTLGSATIGGINLVDGSQPMITVSAPEGAPPLPPLEVSGVDMRPAALGLPADEMPDPAAVNAAIDQVAEFRADLQDAADSTAIRRDFVEALTAQFDASRPVDAVPLDDAAALSAASSLGQALGRADSPISMGDRSALLGLFR